MSKAVNPHIAASEQSEFSRQRFRRRRICFVRMLKRPAAERIARPRAKAFARSGYFCVWAGALGLGVVDTVIDTLP
jgi:hypothetical protein